MNKEERKFKSNINENECLIIETPDYIKAMPLTIPGSGLMIISEDRRFHHYDIYEEKGKQEMYLKGYSNMGELYVCSGQNTFKINPEIQKIEMIPRDEIPKINYFTSSGQLHVETNAPGYVVYIKKQY